MMVMMMMMMLMIFRFSDSWNHRHGLRQGGAPCALERGRRQAERTLKLPPFSLAQLRVALYRSGAPAAGPRNHTRKVTRDSCCASRRHAGGPGGAGTWDELEQSPRETGKLSGRSSTA